MQLKVGWSCGNPFYYGYGFDIQVEDIPSVAALEAQLQAANEQMLAANIERDEVVESHRHICQMLAALGREIELYLNTESPEARRAIKAIKVQPRPAPADEDKLAAEKQALLNDEMIEKLRDQGIEVAE
jgi:hypothetical protein